MVTLLPRLPSTHSITPLPVHGGPLGHEVVDVVAPVLDGGIAETCAFLDHDFDHAGVEGVGVVGGAVQPSM